MKKARVISLLFNLFFILTAFNMVCDSQVVIPEEVENTLKDITKILLLIGSAVCIAKIIHIGILFVTSSAMEKSQAKEALLPWIIGTIVCFGAATIGGSIINLFTSSKSLPSTVLEY